MLPAIPCAHSRLDREPRAKQSYACMKGTSLTEVWDDFCTLQVLERSWPTAARLSALQALQDIEPKRAADLASRVEFAHTFSKLPIFAVAGLKNAGKSSFISAFVSPGNRARIPRGFKSELGTQRFTLWLPQSWESDAERLAQISNLLADVFGHAAELLAALPEEAIRQQTLSESIEKPLLAFDPSLEAQHIALLDCPDIDSAGGHTPESNARLLMLARAGEICVGVMLVVERAKIQVDLIPVLEQHLPQCTQVYAVNAVRDEAPHEVLKDLVQELGHRPEHCYVAFDYEVMGYRERTPRVDPNLNASGLASRKMPFFFEVFPEPERNLPAAVTSERSVLKIGTRFDPETLRKKRQMEQLKQLKANFETTVDFIVAETDKGRGALGSAAAKLFAACKDMLTQDGQPVIKPDLELLEAMADSLKRTAPKDFKPWLWIIGGGLGLLNNAKENADKIKAWLLRKRRGTQAARQMNLLSPDHLCDMLAGWSAACGLVRVAKSWEEDANEILKRFSKEHKTSLAATEWDRFTKQVWEHTPKWRQRMAVVLGMTAGLLAIASAILDLHGGVGLFTLGYAKLISVLGIGGGMVVVGEAGREHEAMIKKLALLNISDFFAITADRVGVPRDVPKPFAAGYPPPLVPEQRYDDAYGLVERHWHLAYQAPQALNALRSAIKRFTP